MPNHGAGPDDQNRAFFGHPAGLKTLFFTEMWERLSYYGARTFLFLYMTAEVSHGGRGMSDGGAGLVMALYMSSVYLLSLPGGWIADRFIGQRRAVTWGGIGIALGNAMLALPIDDAFYPGLAIIAVGTGLLKPNISTIVGQLYGAEDNRRSAGFTIYYMGINVGAGLAPLVGMVFAQGETFKGFLGDHGIDPNLCWKFAFAIPAIGMVFGLIQYALGYKRIGDAGLHPTIPSDPKKAAKDRTMLGVVIGGMVALVGGGILLNATGILPMSEDFVGNVFGVGLLIAAVGIFVGFYKTARDHGERARVTAMIPLFIGGIAFFGVFEQASTTLSAFAERLVHRDFLGISTPASFYQFPNAIFIVLLATPFAIMWAKLAKANKEPSSVNKFGIGMVFVAISFIVLLPTVSSVTQLTNLYDTAGKVPFAYDGVSAAGEHLRVSPNYLIVLYLFSTIAELFISPVGLSSMSKLAPQRLAGMVMGTWFLATAIGNYLAGRAAGFSASRGYSFLFNTLIISSLAIAAALFIVAPMIRKMMAAKKEVVLPKATATEKPAPDSAI